MEVEDLPVQPLPVDQLFAEDPGLFAYVLPTVQEREKAKVGDLTKLFFQFDMYKRPRPVWLVIEKVQQKVEVRTFTGAIRKQGSVRDAELPTLVQFDTSHIYRLPLDRPEVENPAFNVDYRDERAFPP